MVDVDPEFDAFVLARFGENEVYRRCDWPDTELQAIVDSIDVEVLLTGISPERDLYMLERMLTGLTWCSQSGQSRIPQSERVRRAELKATFATQVNELRYGLMLLSHQGQQPERKGN